MSTSPHPSREKWQCFATQQLSEQEASDLLDHLASCEICSKLVADLEAAQMRQMAGMSHVSASDMAVPSVLNETAFHGLVERAAEQTADGGDASTPADIDAQARQLRQPVGSHVGPYQLSRQLGEGGFGVVYEAEQERPIQRRVAVKLIKPGMDTRRVMARFEAERQALAMMDHPHIARVLDAGSTDSGHPYFVMELVDGQPITKHCEQEGLNVRQRVELLIHVCQAVQHAHQKGIIHRDIKPSNVMVTIKDDQPIIKVIDFGVAKALDEPLLTKSAETRAEHIVGTPLYMSPEQAAGDGIDTRSDVYALGVLLYELLTATTPFGNTDDGKAERRELLRAIAEDDAQRPSQRVTQSDQAAHMIAQSELARDLDWIVLKALQKKSDQRYQSAADLADDLRRYLNGDPVEATPPTLAYRAAKFWNRHRAAIVASSLVLGAVLASAIAAFVILSNSNTRLAAAAKEIKAEKDNAESEVARKREAVDFLIRTFERIDIANSNISTGTPAIQLLLDAFEDLKRNTDRRISDPIVRGELIFSVGQLLKNYGYYELSMEAAELSCDIFEHELGDGSKPYFDSRTMLASSLRKAGKYEEALAIFEDNAARFPTLFPNDKFRAAKRWNDVAVCLEQLERYEEALEIHERVIAQKREILDDSDRSLLLTENNVAIVYSRVGQHDRAVQILKSVVQRSDAAFGRKNKETMDNLYSLGYVQMAAGHLEEAHQIFTEVLEYLEDKLEPHHIDCLSTKWQLAESLWRQGDAMRPDALKIFEEVLKDTQLEESHPHMLRWKWQLQSKYAEHGGEQRSNQLKRQVLSTAYREIHPPGSARSVNSAIQLARLDLEQGDDDGARAIVGEVTQLLESKNVTELILEQTGVELVAELNALAEELENAEETNE